MNNTASTQPLPIGVVIPTLNCRPTLAGHLARVTSWAPLVEEIVVVDSHSRDGSFEFLRENLKHPRARFLQHPPGLYASWNYGLSQLTAAYAYLSTVGDAIDAHGLAHLVRTAEGLRADVVVSRPVFVDAAGVALPDYRWPLHHLLAHCPLSGPAVLPSWQTFMLNSIDLPQTLMGSSASNLYRTRTVRQFPFPEDFGHAGDSAWGVRHAFGIVFAVNPEVFSTFVLHANEHTGMPEEKHRALLDKFLDLVRSTADTLAGQPGVPEALRGLLPVLCQYLSARRRLMDCQLDYYRARKAFFPWFANPRAWRARHGRNVAREAAQSLSQLLAARLEKLDAPDAASAAFTEYLKLRLARV